MKRASARAGKGWRSIAVACLLAAAVIGPAAVANAAPVGGPAVIIGHVRTVTGAPIANVTVLASGNTSDTEIYGFAHRAVTKSDGSFLLTDLPQGTYELTVNEQTDLHPVLAYSEDYVWSEWAVLDSFGNNVDTRRYIAADTTTDAGVVTLAPSGTVSGRMMDGATAVPGSVITANIMETSLAGTTYYARFVTSGADGRFTIPNARPGEYSLSYTASGSHVPLNAGPGGDSTNGSICSATDEFTVSAGEVVTRPNYEFEAGGEVNADTIEVYSGNPYGVSGVGLMMTSEADPDIVYTLVTGDDGWVHAYMPPGQYFLTCSDDQYNTYDAGGLPVVQTVTGGAQLNRVITMTASTGTYAVAGRVTEAATGADVFPWVETFKNNPDPAADPEPFRAVQAQGDGRYMVRLPKVTGYAGNRMIVRFTDRLAPFPHVQKSYTTPLNPTADIPHNDTLLVGGVITGFVHDSDGAPVEGVLVNATHLEWVPFLASNGWRGNDRWWTHTEADGSYSIEGLPTGTDYKVNFSAYYDPGMPLPIKYADYYRRTYKNRPLLDSLNTSATPVWVDHTPVAATLGSVTSGVDETISLGGYVALHADGPSAPTGAVYCDVMFQVPNGKWVEVDSGYTTGGTFQKLWKVLPTGHYRLDYADYFGRGSGSWEFDLNAGESKYTSVVVPTPLTTISLANLGGSFAGLIGGGQGLELGGTGGLHLDVDALGALVATQAPPSGLLLYANSAFDFHPSSTVATGTWTLTLPYDPSIPDAVVGGIRVWHVRNSGVGELLTPISWNTSDHTVQVQTSSLSPFQVVYSKQKVAVGTPSTSGTLRSNHTFTSYVSLSPKHTAGLKSAQVKAYTYSTRSHKWIVYKTFTATNQNYRGGTRCKASVKLKRGTYRLYGYGVADAWHLATLGSKYHTIKVR